MKFINEDLVRERLEKRGYYHNPNDDDIISQVEDYYNLEFFSEFDHFKHFDTYINEENTADGYTVFTVRHDSLDDKIYICEDVFYNESSLSEELTAIFDEQEYSTTEEKKRVFIYDMSEDWFMEEIKCKYYYLEERTREEIIDELHDEGYIYENK